MTKPTRQQEQAAEKLVQALLLVAEATRLDPKGTLDSGGFATLADLIALASGPYQRDEVVGRAVEARLNAMQFRAGTSDLFTLMDTAPAPLEILRMEDDALRDLIDGLEEELGEI